MPVLIFKPVWLREPALPTLPVVALALTFVLIFILIASFLENLSLMAAKAAALLVKLPNYAGYCYRANIFQRMRFRFCLFVRLNNRRAAFEARY